MSRQRSTSVPSEPALCAVLLLLALQLFSASPTKAAPVLTTLHHFTGADGRQPIGDLVMDADGALYGTTRFGGTSNLGTVFRLSPPAAGLTQWKQNVLHSFVGPDGSDLQAGLSIDADGTLYGTTAGGGASNGGTVFQLLPPAPGKKKWKHRLLHEFVGPEGFTPMAGLIMDADGALYGVAAFGGTSNLGTAFQMRPPEPGKNRWKYKVLHSFSGPDGRQPFAVLAMDGAGVLFGTTWVGGASSAGTIFQLLPPAPGKSKWEHELLHSFVSTDGSGPHGGLAIGAHGTLYGTTTFGGASAIAGTIFQLRRPAAGKKIWKHTVLHDFTGGADGSQPPAGLIRDGAGVLYGTVQHGGLGSEGTVFRMLPPSTFEVLYTFTSAPPGGREPFAGLTMGPDGALYGATQAGGTSGAGTVFKLVP